MTPNESLLNPGATQPTAEVRCWGIRTARDHRDLISSSLREGVLRQGWGSEDLRTIGQRCRDRVASAEDRSVWRYTQRMLDIEPGHLVVTPHQLSEGRQGVWEVLRGYEFDPVPDVWGPGKPDFGHTLLVKPAGQFDHRSAHATSDLRRALTSGFRQRMRNLDEHVLEITSLKDEPGAQEPSAAAEHFAVVRRRVRDELHRALRERYRHADFEAPVAALLEALYPGAVSHTAGPRERGRDFVIEDVDRLGLQRTIIVQVKAWSGELGPEALKHGLDQLRNGIAAQDGAVDLAVLLTLTDALPEAGEQCIATVEAETGVRTTVLLKNDTLDLLLDHLGQLEV